MLPRLFWRSTPGGSAPFCITPRALRGDLGLRNGSRLRRRLVRERQIAADASAFTYDLAKGSDLLVVDATARPGVAAERLEQEVADEIDTIVRDGIEVAEVERAVAVIQTSFVSALQEAGERADRLSLFATYFRAPELVNEEVNRYQAVTVEHVNDFIRERLGENNRASLLYVAREASADDVGLTGAAAAR